MRGGYVKIYRELLDKPIWKNSTNEQRLFLINLLLLVQWKPVEWDSLGNKMQIKPGQIFISLRHLESALNLTHQVTRTSLKRFEKMGFLTQQPTHAGILISIVNWEKYQGSDGNPTQEPTQVQHKEPKNQHTEQHKPNTTIIKEGKEGIQKEGIKKDEEEIHKGEIINDFCKGDAELESLLNEWLSYRLKEKKPFSDRALNLNLKKLYSLANGSFMDMRKIAEQTIEGGWRGFFQLKNGTTNMSDRLNGFMEAMNENDK